MSEAAERHREAQQRALQLGLTDDSTKRYLELLKAAHRLGWANSPTVARSRSIS
jgi:hypothetical protein